MSDKNGNFGNFHEVKNGNQEFNRLVEVGPGTLFGMYSENWIFGVDKNKQPVFVREEDLNTPRIEN